MKDLPPIGARVATLYLSRPMVGVVVSHHPSNAEGVPFVGIRPDDPATSANCFGFLYRTADTLALILPVPAVGLGALRAFVIRADALGFGPQFDDDEPVDGGDCVELVGDYLPSLRALLAALEAGQA